MTSPLEYNDSGTWVSIATEDYVKTTNISLTGDVTGSGGLSGGVATKLSDTIARVDKQTFAFGNNGDFNVIFPVNGQVNLANTTAVATGNGFLKLNIARKSQDGNSYQGFQVRHDFSATDDVFSLQYDKLSTLSPVFDYSAADDVFKFYKPVSLNQNKITNVAPGVDPSDAATVGQLTGQGQQILLTGDVTGSGSTGQALTTSFNVTRDFDVANNKVVNLKDPGASGDGINLGFLWNAFHDSLEVIWQQAA